MSHPQETHPQDELLKLDNQFCFALYAASRAVVSAYRPLLEALSLTYPQYLVMLVLWEQDDIGVKELGSRLRLDSGTLSPLLKRLEANGLLQRTRRQDDERAIAIRLSPAGLALKARAYAVPISLACQPGLDVNMLISLREQLKELTRLFADGDISE